MFAIAFDLVVAHTAEQHPKGVSQAHAGKRHCSAGRFLISTLDIDQYGALP